VARLQTVFSVGELQKLLSTSHQNVTNRF